MHIRPLTTIEECRQVAALERTVWGYADAEDIMPPAVLIVSIRRGGILLGAFDERGEMKGFVYSLPAIKDGRPTQWSHMLGVTPDARGAGLGIRLKLAQREAALAMDLDLIEWTFDPLQAVSAHLNFSRLGVVAEEYAENVYGASASALHGGAPTDRLIAAWKLRAPHVERRIAAAGPVMRDGSIATAPVVNPSPAGGTRLRPGEPDLTRHERRVMIEVPMGYGEMVEHDPALALEWRLTTRAAFAHYFAAGYRAVDFFLAPAAGKGQYLVVNS